MDRKKYDFYNLFYRKRNKNQELNEKSTPTVWSHQSKRRMTFQRNFSIPPNMIMSFNTLSEYKEYLETSDKLDGFMKKNRQKINN